MLRGSIIGFTRFNALTLEIRKWCYEGGRNIKYWTPLQWMLVIMIMVIPRVGERTAERWLSRIGWSQRGLKGHPSQLHSHYSSFRADTICTNRTSPLCIIFYHPASLCLSAHHQQHHPTVHHQMQNLEGKWGRMMIIIIIDHPVMILPSSRPDICQKIYTAGISGQKFYTIKNVFCDIALLFNHNLAAQMHKISVIWTFLFNNSRTSTALEIKTHTK